MRLDYARVSTDEQNKGGQVDALQAAAAQRILIEQTSGGRWERPELHRMLDQLRPGDTVVLWKLNRLTTTLRDPLHLIDRSGVAGAGFRSLTEAIDTTSPAGRMLMQRLGALAITADHLRVWPFGCRLDVFLAVAHHFTCVAANPMWMVGQAEN